MKRTLSLVAALIITLAMVVPVAADQATIYANSEDGYCQKNLSTGTVTYCDAIGNSLEVGATGGYAYRGYWSFPFDHSTWDGRGITSAVLKLGTQAGLNANPMTVWLYYNPTNWFPLGTSDWTPAGDNMKASNSAYDIYDSNPYPELNIQYSVVRNKGSISTDWLYYWMRIYSEVQGSNIADVFRSANYTNYKPRLVITYITSWTLSESSHGTNYIVTSWDVDSGLRSDDDVSVAYNQSDSPTLPAADDPGWVSAGTADALDHAFTINNLSSGTGYWVVARQNQYPGLCPDGFLCSDAFVPGAWSTSFHTTTD